MPLTDDCHSIDRPNMGDILENIKFPNYPEGDMNSQSTSLPTVPQLQAEPAQQLVPAAEIAVPPQAPAKKDRIRRVLLAGAAAALLATASWYGWDYWTVGRFLVSTDDAYVKADNTTIAPKVSGYLNQVLVA